MSIIINTEENTANQCTIRCLICDKILLKATTVIDGIIKCEKCHRRYSFNVKEGSISIKIISQPQN